MLSCQCLQNVTWAYVRKGTDGLFWIQRTSVISVGIVFSIVFMNTIQNRNTKYGLIQSRGSRLQSALQIWRYIDFVNGIFLVIVYMSDCGHLMPERTVTSACTHSS